MIGANPKSYQKALIKRQSKTEPNIPYPGNKNIKTMDLWDEADAEHSETVIAPLSLEKRLDMIIEECGEISLMRFKKEATKAWKRKYNEPPMRDFQKFVKMNIKTVRDDNIDDSHANHMKIIGQMWRDNKRQRQNPNEH